MSTRTSERLLSLDVFRGLTVAGMLLVNDPGSWAHIHPPLRHAEWHGWTPTDLIFPFFLFIVGVTTHLSLESRRARGAADGDLVRQVLRRGAIIFLLGLLLNGFPFFSWSTIPGNADPSFLDRVVHRLENWRLLGVLQRIALAYVAAALLTLGASTRRVVVTAAAILFGYWFVMTVPRVPDTGLPGAWTLEEPARTMAAWWDRLLLDWRRFGLGNHNWAATGRWDPEGVLSTIPAVVTAMLGVLAGRWLGAARALPEKLNGLFAAGALGLAAGSAWHWVFPINKNIWTSSYVVFTAGMACVTLATIMWITDAHGRRGWTRPFVIYGTNPIVAFVGSGLLARTIYSIVTVQYDGKPTPIQTVMYREGFLPWLSPVNASLAFALSFVLFWFVILWLLDRRGIYLKV